MRPSRSFTAFAPKVISTPGESVPEVVTTLTAQWTVNQYTITYDLAGGTAEGNLDTYTIETGAFTLKNPTKSGYTFTGWSGACTGTGPCMTTIAGPTAGAVAGRTRRGRRRGHLLGGLGHESHPSLTSSSTPVLDVT